MVLFQTPYKMHLEKVTIILKVKAERIEDMFSKNYFKKNFNILYIPCSVQKAFTQDCYAVK